MFKPKEFDEFYSIFFDYNVSLFSHLKDVLKITPTRILDIACGTGVSTRALAKVFSNAHVLGFDYEESLISHAKQLYVPSNVTYEISSVENFQHEFTEFDLIVVKSAAHLFSNNFHPDQLLGAIPTNSCLCIIEKSNRSINLQVPDDVDNFIIDDKYFKDNSIEIIKKNLASSSIEIATSRFGQVIPVDRAAYIKGIEERQYSFLWGKVDKLLLDWVDSLDKNHNKIKLFEEFDIMLAYKL